MNDDEQVADDRNAQTVSAYERAAHVYRAASPTTPYPDIAAFLDQVAARVPGGTVLELGCGPGVDAYYLESAGLRVVRTDATVAFVEALRAEGERAEVLNAVTDPLGGPFDAVYAGAMLLHLTVDDLATVLGKARAAASVLTFTVKEGDGEEWTDARLGVLRWFRYWREADLRAVVGDADWRVESLQRVTGKREPWLHVIAS